MVNGFCDAQDGSLYKLRLMPQSAGDYQYTIDFTVRGKKYSYQNKFKANGSKRNDSLQVDAENPTHFIYRGSKQHFFWNGTTTYCMLGWKDERIITQAIDRLAGYGINRIHVAINSQAHGGSRWNENNVVESEKFTFKLNPWLAKAPDDLDNPGFDVTRFNVAHWQKMDCLCPRKRNCCEQTTYWKMKPETKAVNSGNLCLSIPDQEYLLYTRFHYARISLKKGDQYSVKMINPRTGEESIQPDANTSDWSWQYPKELKESIVFVLKRK